MTNHEASKPPEDSPEEVEYDAAGTPIVRMWGVPWRVAETDADGNIVITREQWDAAANDPEVIKLVEEARAYGEKFEEVEDGVFHLKPEYQGMSDEDLMKPEPRDMNDENL
jgi:hypothetical protein